MELILLSIRNSVSCLSAARCKYVKSSCPSRKRSYSSGTGSLTFTIRSAASKTSSAPPTTRAPAASYSSSEKPLPRPAPDSTTTSRSWWTSSTTPSGCMLTRPSWSLISLGTTTTPAMLTPPYALLPQYLISGYYKPATILILGVGTLVQLQQLYRYTVRLISGA